MMIVEPVVLEGRNVRLEPLGLHHASQLWAVAGHPEIWRYMPFAMESEQNMRQFIARAVQMAEAATALPFAIINTATGEAIGSTGYWNIETTHRRLEIGASWLTPAWQRTAANTEAKYLLLKHAFETLGCIRVEFKTDSLNQKSREALKRIGATEEGTLRNHMIQPDGRLRHSVYFSLIETEWPEVKARLEKFLES